MLIKTEKTIPESAVTDPELFRQRRKIIQAAAGSALLSMSDGWVSPLEEKDKSYANLPKCKYSLDEPPTAYEDITSYNNFYEFGTSKEAPAKLSQSFKTDPWSITIEGEVEKPGLYTLEDVLRGQQLEERIYRLRCVEAWSLVAPWIGFSLGAWLKQYQPTSKAKFVEFTTLYDPKQMPGQKTRSIHWPYVEALRIDEAMHPLTIIAVGLYGEVLPNQNGAPLRLVVPWKYGFKSIKSIVKVRFTEQMPETSWHKNAPHEYGFYANVNPQVNHPRWSQKRERVLGASIFTPKRPTELFNGYAEQVGQLYAGMNLRKNY